MFGDTGQLWQLTMQEPASVIQEGIWGFHNDIMGILIGIVVLVCVIQIRSVYLCKYNNVYNTQRVHGVFLEIVWTIIPALVLVLILIPSFALLYGMEEEVESLIQVKVVGHQWYWLFEVNEELDFDSYMILEEDLQIGELRLLEVDNRLLIPERSNIRFIITSGDVLHSFAIPSLGVKLDACPGRLNEVVTYVKRQGVFYGQCSELCGVNHAFMPIVIEVVSGDVWLEWYINK